MSDDSPIIITPGRVVHSPFGQQKTMWCHDCQDQVDAKNEAGSRGEQYVWSAKCGRCGAVLSWGVYEVPHAGHMSHTAEMKNYVTRPGRDRR